MTAKKYLNNIGFSDFDTPDPIFNDDDKSYYTLEELMESYATYRLENLKKEIRQLLIDEDLELIAEQI